MRSDVKFNSARLKLAGHLYTPDDGGVGPRPAIVVRAAGATLVALLKRKKVRRPQRLEASS
jgi:hypothetical protein